MSHECLDRIAIGLGYDKGYFTEPRIPLSPEATAEKLEESWGNLVPVPVCHLATHTAIRQLAQCHATLVSRSSINDSVEDFVRELVEWLDLASYVLCAADTHSPSPAESRRRELYADILDCVRRIELHGFYVLGGVMDASKLGFDNWNVAVVSITPRGEDPGAPKRRIVFVDRRCIEGPGSREGV